MGLRREPGLAGDFGLVVLWVAGSSRMWLDHNRGLKGFLLLVVEAHPHGLFRVILTLVRSLRGFLPLLDWSRSATGAQVEAWA